MRCCRGNEGIAKHGDGELEIVGVGVVVLALHEQTGGQHNNSANGGGAEDEVNWPSNAHACARPETVCNDGDEDKLAEAEQDDAGEAKIYRRGGEAGRKINHEPEAGEAKHE